MSLPDKELGHPIRNSFVPFLQQDLLHFHIPDILLQKLTPPVVDHAEVARGEQIGEHFPLTRLIAVIEEDDHRVRQSVDQFLHLPDALIREQIHKVKDAHHLQERRHAVVKVEEFLVVERVEEDTPLVALEGKEQGHSAVAGPKLDHGLDRVLVEELLPDGEFLPQLGHVLPKEGLLVEDRHG